MPRFQSVETSLAGMDANEISTAFVCPFEACPDLTEVHRALLVAGDRFRAFGLALGRDESTIEAGMHAQLDAGFEGFRLPEDRIREAPFILDVIGARGGTAMPVGGNGLLGIAPLLLSFLQRYPQSLVLSPHMAGPTTPDVIADNPAVHDLFTHPRFLVVLTRQVRPPPTLIEDWVQALVETVGWDRLMWGSEAPVLYWRDDTIAGAASSFDRYLTDPKVREALFGGTATRTILARPRPPIGPLDLPYDAASFLLQRPAPMWPLGFTADTRVPGPLVAQWIRAGGAAVEPLNAFTSRLLLEALDRRER